MKEFFEAKKIAVIGAARENYKVGHIIFANLLENKMLKVFPVNPNADKILGVKTFPDVLLIPYTIDLAIIVIPAVIVPAVLEQCGEKNIKNVMIISAGFEESGNRELTNKIREITEKYKINLIGPNVMGFINTYKGLNASFFSGNLEKGKVSFISQSGAIGSAVLDKIIERGMGFSTFISLGNMLYNDFISALKYLKDDRNTEVIMLYIESLKDETGREFIELCREIEKTKKLIVLKSGKTKEGLKAAKSHTASLSSSSAIYSGAFKQSGILEVSSLEEMFDLAEIFSKYGKFGKKAVVVSNAGGLGVLAVDSLVEAGIEIVEIPEKILKEFDSFIPRGYSRSNPLDILGDALADRYEKVLKILDRENWLDFFVVLVSPQAMTQALETAKILVKLKKPVFSCFVGGSSFEKAKKFLLENNVINFEDVSELNVLGKI